MIEQITLDDITTGFGSTNYRVGLSGVSSISYIEADEWSNPYGHDFFRVEREGMSPIDVPYEKVLLIFPRSE